MASSVYQAWSVIAGETPTTAKWNLLGSNDASFNSGVGFNDGALGTRVMKPNYMQSTGNNNGTGSRQSSTANFTVTGVSITYTTGPSNEVIELWGTLLMQASSGGCGVQIMANGAIATRRTYWDGTTYLTHYPRGLFLASPNTTYTFTMQTITTGTTTVCNSNTDSNSNFHPSLEMMAWSR